jgi:hypothetical protein
VDDNKDDLLMKDKKVADRDQQSGGGGIDIDDDSTPMIHITDPTSLTNMLRIVGVVWIYLFTKVITSVANAIVATTFLLVLKDIYRKDETFIGVCLATTTGVSALVNGLLLGSITESFGQNIDQLILYCVHASLVLCVIMAAFAWPAVSAVAPYNGIWIYVALTVALGIFQYMLATLSTSASTAKVERQEKGTLVGMEHSAHAAAGVFGPGIGTLLLTHGGVTAGCAAVFAGVALSWAYWADGMAASRKTVGSWLHMRRRCAL